MADQNSKTVGRRITLQVLGVGGLSATGLSATGLSATGLLGLAGCGNSGDESGGGSGAAGGAAGCDAPIDAQSRQLRTTLQYREVSQEEGKNCENCAQYIADAHGDCGGCRLFSGPVQPGGHCQSWAPLAANEPAPAEDEAPAEAEEAPAEEATEEG